MSEDKSKLQLIGEIAQANNKNLELIVELNKKEDEIERLNNIINELEKWIKEDTEKSMMTMETGRAFNMFDILDKLQELKGSDKE